MTAAESSTILHVFHAYINYQEDNTFYLYFLVRLYEVERNKKASLRSVDKPNGIFNIHYIRLIQVVDSSFQA